MKLSKDILNELREIAPVLAKLDKKEFYTVSDGYFGESSVKILELVEDVKNHAIQLPPVLASIKKEEHYSVPQGYFSSFSDQLMQRIHTEEVIEELAYAAPGLIGAEKKELYKVPADYFSTFPAIVSKLATSEAEAHDSPIEHEISRWAYWIERAVSILSRPRYTFAMACLIATVIVVSVVLTHSTLTPEERIFAQMQQIPEGELQNYMGKHRDEFDEHIILNHINDIEFIHSLDRPGNMPAHLRKGTKETTDNISEDIID